MIGIAMAFRLLAFLAASLTYDAARHFDYPHLTPVPVTSINSSGSWTRAFLAASPLTPHQVSAFSPLHLEAPWVIRALTRII